MFIRDIFSKKNVFSMEVFPPKRDDGHEKLLQVIREVKNELHPDFISVTYGAGGSTRSLTQEIATEIKFDIGIESMAHLTCVENTREEMREVIGDLKQAGIKNILALRGDPPQGEEEFKAVKGGFAYGSELVEYIKEVYPEACIGVAAYPEKHPEAESLDEDIQHLKTKMDAGGDFMVTQLFFNNDHLFRFMDKIRARGIEAPVLPGIFLISSYKQLHRITELSNAEIPARLEEKLYRYKDNPEDVKKFGIEFAVTQSEKILEQGLAGGLHYYIMNRNDMISSVYDAVKNNFEMSKK